MQRAMLRNCYLFLLHTMSALPVSLMLRLLVKKSMNHFVTEKVNSNGSIWETLKKEILPRFINNNKTLKVKIDNKEVQVCSVFYHLTLVTFFSLFCNEGKIVYIVLGL